MAWVRSVGVKDLRSLSNTGLIEICPITILVGKNSAGKSTFARIFPLLRQSSEEEKKAPILWFGRRVDFGDFKTSYNRNSDSGVIEFLLELVMAPRERNREYFSWIGEEIQRTGKETKVEVTLALTELDNNTVAKSVAITLFGHTIKATFEGQKVGVFVDDIPILLPDGSIIRTTQQRILPALAYYKLVTRKIEQAERKVLMPYGGDSPYSKPLIEIVHTRLADKRTKQESIKKIIDNIPIGDDQSILEALRNAPYASKHFREKAAQIQVTDVNFIEIRNLLFARNFSDLLEQIDDLLGSYLDGVRYIEPLRATAQRYYRRQELAIDELDSKGENIAMFVDGLQAGKKSDLNDWLYQHFGVKVNAENAGGHVTLELEIGNGSRSTNLADLGFGFSQLLPIAIQLWQATQPPARRGGRLFRKAASSTIVVEQPELHLHPAYQANLADIFASTISIASQQPSRKDQGVSIIAETHSPHLINRLGRLIEKGALSANDVQIVLFDQENASDVATVRTARFDSEGVLQDWPFGFFEPSEI